MSTPTPTNWPAGFSSTPPPQHPATVENAIIFGFKLAIGMTLWFVPFGIVASIILSLWFAAIGRIH